MKKLLLPLSCLLALSACWRDHRPQEPDFDPSRDIPAGTLVLITLQDVHDASRSSTFLVDPRSGRVVERKDGTPGQGEKGSVAEGTTQQGLLPGTAYNILKVPCAETQKTDETTELGCTLNAIDPKHESDGNPNPIKDYEARLTATKKFVVNVAVNVLKAAHDTGVNITTQSIRQTPR
ncbi:hypothetical protein JY651_04120 [Pyxidicoccus parkwayensis]|uniref:Lipoprotein n=1 Tax=Pyxidicoccus parkwayensis TaxID=2813578 RepID=A0ABX7P1W1_9BACT|nr:hypothetical protein [Pyxidicoccus parkwaysis]QSQ24166.1 hypothetical protein JY651_04120 [Pyxidicoccus parkwaysis]